MPSDPLSPDEQYDVAYRATRDAMWDVLGTAVYLLFLVFAASIGLFALVVPAVGALAGGSAGPLVVGVGLFGLLVVGFAAYRVARLLGY